MNHKRRRLLGTVAAALIGTTLTACGASVVAPNPAASPTAQPHASERPLASDPGTSVSKTSVPVQPATPTIVAAQPQQPILAFSPDGGGPGTVVQVSGSGYVANVPVKIRLGTPQPIGEVLASATTDARGRWQVTFTMPDRLPSGDLIPAAQLRLVAMNDQNQALASAPFRYVPPTDTNDPPPVVTIETAPHAVRDLLDAYMNQRDGRAYLAPNLRAELDAGTPIDQLLRLRQDTLRSVIPLANSRQLLPQPCQLAPIHLCSQ